MKRLLKWLRNTLVWTGPLLVLLLAVLCGFGYWVLGTSVGTRWALVTVAEQFDGKASGVEGSIWDGVQVEQFSMALPGTSVDIERFHLQANWRELLDGSIHIADLSVGALQLDLQSSQEEKPSEPFSMPVLPFSLAVDHLGLDKLAVTMDGEPLPVDVSNLSTSVALNQDGGQLVLQSLDVELDQLRAGLSGEARVLDLKEPWPLQAQIATRAEGLSADSPLCANRYLPALSAIQNSDDQADAPAASSQNCALDINTTLDGSMEALNILVKGSGQGMKVDADVNLTPQAAFPLKDAMAALELADGSSLHAQVDWHSSDANGTIQDQLTGTLKTSKLDVGKLVGDAIPDLLLTMATDFNVELLNHSEFRNGRLSLNIQEGSRWNQQALSGHLKTQAINEAAPGTTVTSASTGQEVDTEQQPDAQQPPIWQAMRLSDLDMDLVLGKNHLKADGALGLNDSSINLDVQAPELDAFWPDLPGGADLKGVIAGGMAQHTADLTAQYTPEQSQAGQLGKAPMKAHVALAGSWGKDSSAPDSPEGWRGTVKALEADHASLGLKTGAEIPISFFPSVQAPDWQWQVGQTKLNVLMSSRPVLTLAHQASRGGAGRWETAGAIDRLNITQRLIDDIQKLIPASEEDKADRGGVKVSGAQSDAGVNMALALNWDMKFDGALAGQAHVRRLSGDITVPGDKPIPLGLETLALDVGITPTGAALSRVQADVKISTRKMGHVTANAVTLLHSPEGSFSINPQDTKVVTIDADMGDLGWTSLFLDDSMELGGSVQAKMRLESQPNDSWRTDGSITGKELKIVRVDDGIRLLDGTLAARFDNDRLILDELSFPAVLRVTPKEWRTAEWISTNPDAKDGKLTVSGEWYLFESRGAIDVKLHRYPIMQRSDRYAMISGDIHLDAELPAMAIDGSITADAGWFDLDMLGGIPTVDGDVVVIRPGEEQQAPSVPMDLSMNMKVDLGPRFYLTGYGLNSGLTGGLTISMIENKLTGMGALRTRGGLIEAYGQRLQLRQGAITFQGDITNPLLDIEALRTGLDVEAGVHVGGTAKKPKIDLVSYPDVDELEKLSWLLMGHGPDDSGSDVALLFSVGASLISGGEPFYRQVGIDEVSMLSGDLGAVGSVLPAESVVNGLDSDDSDAERKFLLISKNMGHGITLSIRQALSDTGTVGRASYRLARGLTAELSAGTVNGLALIYRWFSRD